MARIVDSTHTPWTWEFICRGCDAVVAVGVDDLRLSKVPDIFVACPSCGVAQLIPDPYQPYGTQSLAPLARP